MNSGFFEILLALPMALAGAAALAVALLRPRAVSLLTFGLIFFSLQFCVGPVFFPETSSFPVSVMAYTWFSIYLFWLTIAALARLWPSPFPALSFKVNNRVENPRGIFSSLAWAAPRVSIKALLAGACVVNGFRAFLQFKYHILLSGSAGWFDAPNIPYTVLSANQVLVMAGVGLAWLAWLKILYRAPGRSWLWAILLLETLFVFTQGRRWIFAYFFTLVIIWLATKPRMKPKHAAFGVLIAIFLWQFAFPFFFLVRIEWQTNPQDSPIDWTMNAIHQLHTGADAGASSSSENVQSRLLAVGNSFIVSQGLLNGVSPFHGQILGSALLSIVPSVIFPNKYNYVLFDKEAVNGRFGVDPHLYADITTNLPMIGLADFGLPGGIVYGLYFFVVIRLIEYACVACLRRSPVTAMLALGTVCMNTVMQMECTTGSDLIMWRAALILLVAAWAVNRFTSRQLYDLPTPTTRTPLATTH